VWRCLRIDSPTHRHFEPFECEATLPYHPCGRTSLKMWPSSGLQSVLVPMYASSSVGTRFATERCSTNPSRAERTGRSLKEPAATAPILYEPCALVAVGADAELIAASRQGTSYDDFEAARREILKIDW
jgi:hypothetical protein